MSNPDYNGIKQIQVDYNLIEVKPFGCCFDIESKSFVMNPLSSSKHGELTPRSYVSYTYTAERVPKPTKYVSILSLVMNASLVISMNVGLLLFH